MTYDSTLMRWLRAYGPLLAAFAFLVTCGLYAAHQETADALPVTKVVTAQPSPQGNDVLTPTGAVWLRVCEVENFDGYRTHTGNGYSGAYQFSQATWDYIAEIAGEPAYVGVQPAAVPAEIQDKLARFLWAIDKEAWPYCFDDADRAMGISSVCLGRNVFGCGARPRPGLDELEAYRAEASADPETFAEGNPKQEVFHDPDALAPEPTFTG